MLDEEVAEYVDCMMDALQEKLAEKKETPSFETLGKIMWGMIRKLTNKESSPYLRIVDFEEMLSPYSEDFIDKTIPKWAWNNIKVRADSILVYAKENKHILMPAVKKHLENISAGNIPYGYSLSTEEEEQEIA